MRHPQITAPRRDLKPSCLIVPHTLKRRLRPLASPPCVDADLSALIQGCTADLSPLLDSDNTALDALLSTLEYDRVWLNALMDELFQANRASIEALLSSLDYSIDLSGLIETDRRYLENALTGLCEAYEGYCEV